MNAGQVHKTRVEQLGMTPLNLRTTERWLRCETGSGHRYSWDATIVRDYEGTVVEVRTCLRCKVPEPREAGRTLGARAASARRGSKAGGQTRRERAA